MLAATSHNPTMRKDLKLIILIFVIAIPYFWLKFRPRTDIKPLLKPRVINLDPDGSKAKKYILYFQIDSLLLAKNCSRAQNKVDSALDETKADIMLIDFKGQALLCNGDARGSLIWFNKAIEQEGWEYPKALGHRAQAYTAIKMFDSAISDLKECAEINYDYTKELAAVYERAGKPDSAIKYFEIFLAHYPDSLRIQNSLLKLKGSG